jgi:hypothetical protein
VVVVDAEGEVLGVERSRVVSRVDELPVGHAWT